MLYTLLKWNEFIGRNLFYALSGSIILLFYSICSIKRPVTLYTFAYLIGTTLTFYYRQRLSLELDYNCTLISSELDNAYLVFLFVGISIWNKILLGTASVALWVANLIDPVQRLGLKHQTRFYLYLKQYESFQRPLK